MRVHLLESIGELLSQGHSVFFRFVFALDERMSKKGLPVLFLDTFIIRWAYIPFSPNMVFVVLIAFNG